MGISGRQVRDSGCYCWLFHLSLSLALFTARASAQEGSVPSAPPALPEFSGAASLNPQGPPESPQPNPSETSSNSEKQKQLPTNPGENENPPAKLLFQRILGVIPNFHFISPGEKPPPPTPKQDFVIATRNSFDYSSFLLIGFSSVWAEGFNAHKQLGKGVAGFGRYYWRGFADEVDGNYMVYFALPTIFHQDERYYAIGRGGFLKRVAYSVSRVVTTPNYQGQPSFNVSELLGRGIEQSVSATYYPSQSRTLGALAGRYGIAIGEDALADCLREFWPDISTHILHRHP